MPRDGSKVLLNILGKKLSGIVNGVRMAIA